MKNLIIQIITTILITCLSVVTTYYAVTTPNEGVGAIALIGVLPLCIIFYAITFLFLIASFIFGIKTTKKFKITSSIILTFTFLILALNILTALSLFNVISLF